MWAARGAQAGERVAGFDPSPVATYFERRGICEAETVFDEGDIVGNFEIVAHLKTGGMASLYLARRRGVAGFSRLVAIKVVRPQLSTDEKLVRMFINEALLSARINHPNVVHVEELGQVHGDYFLVMEYVHGCSLSQLMRALRASRRRLTPMTAVAVAARIAEGLHAAHSAVAEDGSPLEIVHRDVSPQNVLLSHAGHVKIIDFGVAKAQLSQDISQTNSLKGKLAYMAPEQATTGKVDARSDIYALGIILWEMLTMRRLFFARTDFEVLLKVRDPKIVPPSEHNRDVPPELDAVVMAALHPDREQRPITAKEFRRRLVRAFPRAMEVDSAHLADLLSTLLGEELDAQKMDLPDEVTRLLAAESQEARLPPVEDSIDGEVVEAMTAVLDGSIMPDAFDEPDDKSLESPADERISQPPDDTDTQLSGLAFIDEESLVSVSEVTPTHLSKDAGARALAYHSAVIEAAESRSGREAAPQAVSIVGEAVATRRMAALREALLEAMRRRDPRLLAVLAVAAGLFIGLYFAGAGPEQAAVAPTPVVAAPTPPVTSAALEDEPDEDAGSEPTVAEPTVAEPTVTADEPAVEEPASEAEVAPARRGSKRRVRQGARRRSGMRHETVDGTPLVRRPDF